MRNIFVIGLDPFNLETAQSLRESRSYEFKPLLPLEAVHTAESYDYDQLVADADDQLHDTDGTVDAVVTWWDFPSSGLVPVITEMWDLYGPSLKSVVTLEHKYWSRLVQRTVATDHVPPFAAFDPFAEDSLQGILDSGLEYPFWIKPVKSVASYLGFRIDGPDDFDPALQAIRKSIRQYGDPFAAALSRVGDLPHEIEWLGALGCIAEKLVGGWQCTLEGYVSHGNVTVYGTVDSLREEGASTFRGYQYPSQLPLPVLQRMEQVTSDVITAVGLDHSCFNVEFFYDADVGRVWLLEVNTRLSQSHCDLFAKVDGASSQRAMIDVALGRSPRMPYRSGEYPVAAKYFLRSTVDGVVRTVPSPEVIEEIDGRFPGTRIEIDVTPGTRLSDLAVQESYSYELGRVYVGGDDYDDLDRRFAQVKEMLAIEIDEG